MPKQKQGRQRDVPVTWKWPSGHGPMGHETADDSHSAIVGLVAWREEGLLTRTGDGEDAVRDAEHHAQGVDGLTGVGTLISFFHVPDSQGALPSLAHN